jgi:hypothetical protein
MCATIAYQQSASQMQSFVWPKDRSAVHSTRIGAAHNLTATGIDLISIMHSGELGRCTRRVQR